MSQYRRPAVFLDRDGTLNEERGYITHPDHLRLLPGVAEAVRLLRDAGFACVVVTNQSAIGRGLMSEADLHLIHERLHQQLHAEAAKLDGLYFCPALSGDHPERKPAPGMLLRAARDLELDLTRSWMVGDTASDMLAGQNAGCRCILVRSGHDVGAALTHLTSGDAVANDLPEAARLILTLGGEPLA
jgi:D-glycero-D-manno-heptose 1,7-bisphosphate phosphatase